jgi:hypothetical protein
MGGGWVQGEAGFNYPVNQSTAGDGFFDMGFYAQQAGFLPGFQRW